MYIMPLPSPGCKKNLYIVRRPKIYFTPSSLPAYKKPGVRPIGIGDTARRIIAKAVLSVAKPDIQEASGCLQMCGGQISGIEAAVHAVRTIFNSSDTEAVLLVDATNSLNRQVTLQNIRRLCPPLATILINTYRTLQMAIRYFPKKARRKVIHSPCLCMLWPPSLSSRN